jgi:putative addiction module killer protein
MVKQELDLISKQWFQVLTDDSLSDVVTIAIYVTKSGKCPYRDWWNKLEKKEQGWILARLRRLSYGNFGDITPIKLGVFELKYDFGPGYRLYYGMIKGNVVGIIYGGHKGTQDSDIGKALKIWTAYKEKAHS